MSLMTTSTDEEIVGSSNSTQSDESTMMLGNKEAQQATAAVSSLNLQNLCRLDAYFYDDYADACFSDHDVNSGKNFDELERN